jgi:hypothetical protein
MTDNAECAGCGVTAADLPYEELSLDLEEASTVLFEQVDGTTYCEGCASNGGAR